MEQIIYLVVYTSREGYVIMPKIKPIEERVVRANISLKPKTLEAIDGNVLRLQRFLVSRGVDVKQVSRVVTRSALLTELAETLATEVGYNSIKAGFCALFDVDDKQINLFED